LTAVSATLGATICSATYDWWQGTDRQTGSDGKPIPRYRSRLKITLANGKTIPIRTKSQWSSTNSTILQDAHKVIAEAAEILLARSFNSRMDAYEKDFAQKGYVQWDDYQITRDGSLFYRASYCFNLNDPQVRSMLYSFKLVAMLGHKHWWGKLLMPFVRTDETLELERDRDCFLYLLRRHIGLYWPKEVLRVYRGIQADGTPVGGATPQGGQASGQGQPVPDYQSVPPRDTPRPQEAPRARQNEYVPPPPPPPPPPKPRLGEEHYLGILELREGVVWTEVKSGYRSLAKRYHPDLMRGRGASATELKLAEDKLKTINEAYAWLEDYYRMKPKG